MTIARSPDGKLVVELQDESGAGGTTNDLFLMDPQPLKPGDRLTNSGDNQQPAW